MPLAAEVEITHNSVWYYFADFVRNKFERRLRSSAKLIAYILWILGYSSLSIYKKTMLNKIQETVF
jgi:hypothetical protein